MGTVYTWYYSGHLIDTPSTNQGPTCMNQPGFVGRYVLVQGLEQGKFLQMSHRNTTSPFVSALFSSSCFSMFGVPCFAWALGTDMWRRILWKPATHHEPAHGPYYPPGWLLQGRSLRWVDLKWGGCWSLGGCARGQMGGSMGDWKLQTQWAGGRWWKKHRATGLAYMVFPYALRKTFTFFTYLGVQTIWRRMGGVLALDYDLAPFLNTTDLKALLEDTDSMARGAALAAEMGNTDPLKIIAVPHVHW